MLIKGRVIINQEVGYIYQGASHYYQEVGHINQGASHY